MSAFVIGIGSWVVVRDESSPFNGVHGTITVIDNETAIVDHGGVSSGFPLSVLRIPAEGPSPAERAALQKLDDSARDLHVKFDEAAVRLAAEAAQKIPGFNLPPEVMKALGPILELVELAVRAL